MAGPAEFKRWTAVALRRPLLVASLLHVHVGRHLLSACARAVARESCPRAWA